MGGQNHVPKDVHILIPVWGTEPCPQGRPHPDPQTLRLCDVPRQRGLGSCGHVKDLGWGDGRDFPGGPVSSQRFP